MLSLKHALFLSMLLLVALVARQLSLPAPPARADDSGLQKVDPWVLETSADGETEFLVFLREQPDLSATATLTTKEEKGRYVYETLTTLADRTQAPLRRYLEAAGVPHRGYWIANMIWVRADRKVVEALARRPDVAYLYANPKARLTPPPPTLAPLTPTTVAWGVDWINAPAVWAAGVTGEGVVIGGQDTGYDWDHPALQAQYRGWMNGSVDHNYHWHDAIHENNAWTPPGNPCGFDITEPCDDNGHGTHTMGTMVGDDGAENQIGMAPGARWIACRNMEEGWGSPATYTECYQWFVAPTDLNDENPDPARAPHVINNSWACPTVEGCTEPDILQSVVANVRAAGIVTVHAAGNGGSNCSTINTPAAIYDDSFSIGATGGLSGSSDEIASFSSRGPVTVDGSNRLKPDVTAPGVGIRSSLPGGNYGFLSGTSMAAPHVAGLVALLISAEPALAGDVDMIESIITESAVPLTGEQNCGDISGESVPNHTYGYGRVDAWNAYEALQHTLQITKEVSSPLVQPGALLTYTLTVDHAHLFSPTNQVVITDRIPAGTQFVTATLPHTLDGSTVIWNRTSLAASETWSVTLVVQVEASAGTIQNDDYGTHSNEVALVVGEPVVASIGRTVFLPAVFQQACGPSCPPEGR